MRRAIVNVGIAALIVAQAGVIGTDASDTSTAASTTAATPTTTPALTGQVVLIAQNEELDVYDIDAGRLRAEPLVKKTDWVNGPPCFIPGDPKGRFVEADDNPNELGFDGDTYPFFGVFKKDGTRDFDAPFGATMGRIGAEVRLTRDSAVTPFEDPSGCVFDSTGNLFAIDVGYGHTPADGDGAIVEFFANTNYKTYCVIDQDLSQPGMPAFDGGKLYVPETGAGAINRYSNFPTGSALCTPAVKEPWARSETTGIGTPSGIVRAPGGGWAVSSVLAPSGVFRLNDLGVNMGPLAAPGPDTGTPFGFDFDSKGNLFYADLGVQVLPDATDPSTPADAVDGHGALRWVKAGASPSPRPLVTGWNFPDGVKVVPKSAITQKNEALVTCDWRTFGHDLGRSFAAPGACSSLDAGNVATLERKWFLDTGAPVTAQPAIDGGTLYVGSSKGFFYAIDVATGLKRWEFQVTDPNHTDYGTITSSATVATVDGVKVVVFGGTATLYVLEAATGQKLAARCFDPKNPIAGECPPPGNGNTVEIESSPALVPDGKKSARIFIGMDYNEDQNVGPAGLVALRLTRANGLWSLDPQWKYDPETLQTYTIDPLGLKDVATAKGCGNVWSSPAVDAVRQVVVFGVGNCDVAPTLTAGTEIISEAIIGVDFAGTQVFRYRPERDFSTEDPDLDFGATPNVLPGGITGEAGKDGFYYAIGRNGVPVWTANAAMPSDLGGIIGSTAVGMSRGKPAVFASSAIPFNTRGMHFFAGLMQADRLTQAGGLHAIRSSEGDGGEGYKTDEDTGTVLWDAATGPAYGAAVYVGNMVLLPDTFTFSMQAFNADTGVLLWSYPLNGAPASPPAVLGDSMYFGAGIPSEDEPPLNDIGGIWAFQLPPIE